MVPNPIQRSDAGSLPVVADKMMKRKLSNRESARKSRMKKQEKLQALTSEISQLQKENEQHAVFVDAAEKKVMDMEARNKVLMAQKVELERRLESLNSILASKKQRQQQPATVYSMGVPEIAHDSKLLDVMDIPEITDGFELVLGEDFGYSVDSPEIPDHMMNPWQLPSIDFPDMFQC